MTSIASALGASRHGLRGAWVGFILAASACGSDASIAPQGDRGAGDAGSGTDDASVLVDASSCRPGAVQTFVPRTYVHASLRSAACRATSAGDPAQQIYDACFGSAASAAACDAIVRASPADALCWQCIETPVRGATAYGPVLIDSTGFVQPNVAGCVELESSGSLACAKAIQAKAECDLSACQANCPVTPYGPHAQASLADYEGCSDLAEVGGCQGYAALVASACQSADATTGGFCTQPNAGGSFQQFYAVAVPLFCQAVAGADAAADAQTVVDASADDAQSSPEGPEGGDSGSSPRDASGDAPSLPGDASGDAPSLPGDAGRDAEGAASDAAGGD